MSKSRIDRDRIALERFLTYMLLTRPDEFGLVPEKGGYPLKDVIKALAEEGRPVRESGIRELNHLAVAQDRPQPFRIEDNLLTPVLEAPPQPVPVDQLPTLLFGSCRRRGHRHTLERGLSPGRSGWVVLADTEELAVRIGRRYDREPVLITVEAARALSQGFFFAQLESRLFLTNELPVHLLHLPPLPKERPEKQADKTGKVKESKPFLPSPEQMPGSVDLNLDRDPDRKRAEQRDRKRSKKEWQKDRRGHRRDKTKW